MSKDATAGTFEDLIAGASPEVQEICKELRKVILAVHPEAIEVVRLGYKAASYGVGLKKMSEAHTYIMPLKDRANLGFYYGALLEDEAGLLEGTGKKLRHIKVRTLESAKSSQTKNLIRLALDERTKTLGRTLSA